jgi:hypothetical protein
MGRLESHVDPGDLRHFSSVHLPNNTQPSPATRLRIRIMQRFVREGMGRGDVLA